MLTSRDANSPCRRHTVPPTYSDDVTDRDRDETGRPRQARPRDAAGRPLPYGTSGVEPVDETPLPPRETIEAARRLYADGQPFAAHETFEVRWRTCPPAERELWHGLAQIGAGLTHHARGNPIGAERLLERGITRLEAYALDDGPTYGLDLTCVAHWARGEIAAR